MEHGSQGDSRLRADRRLWRRGRRRTRQAALRVRSIHVAKSERQPRGGGRPL